jgi:hypothetical protein
MAHTQAADEAAVSNMESGHEYIEEAVADN